MVVKVSMGGARTRVAIRETGGGVVGRRVMGGGG